MDNLDIAQSHHEMSPDLLEELDKRHEAVKNGTMALHEAKEFVNKWKAKAKTIRSTLMKRPNLS